MKKKVSIKTTKATKKTAPAIFGPSIDEVNKLGALYSQRQYTEAEKLARDLIQRFPKHIFAWKVLGAALHAEGKSQESLQVKEATIQLAPNDPEACNNLGNTYQELNRFAEAEKYLRHAIKIKPDSFMAFNNLGLTLEKQERFAEAENCYQQSIKIQPDYAAAHYNYGNTLQKLDRLEEALKSYQAAINFRPQYIEAMNNYAGVLQKLDRSQDAEDCCRQILALQPGHSEALHNLAVSLERQERLAEAESCYRKSLSLKPDSADTHHNFSALLILTGQWREGWAEYQWSYRAPSAKKPVINPASSARHWEGEPLQGKTILIHAEQGFGDMIQFVRYSQYLQERGARVHVLVAKPLIEIFKTIPWVDRVIGVNDLLQANCDFWVFPLELPYWFQTTLENVPVNIPYLSIDANKSEWWKIWLDKQIPVNHKRIGLVWAGNPVQGNDKNRSLTLSQFSVFANLINITFVSLQLGEKAQQELKNAPAGLNILDAGRFIEDFTDSAALMANLDVLISVCSAPAHLAGALNLPVWTIICRPFDWRWLLDRDDSVWYKSMRLFRQPSRGDWASVLNEVKTALIAL
jgi:tetratricopeptide (TPR) repeat protein/ADP-heptose:LPS heptosyltransferase